VTLTTTGSPPVAPVGTSTYRDGVTENPHQNVSFPSNGGTAHGYLALPESGSGPGLVVIQEWWGLTEHIKDVTDRFAAEGFVALAPDLYGGPTTHDSAEAGQLMQDLPVTRAAADLAGAVDLLLSHDAVTSSTVGAVGFCMGGGFVLVLAAQQGDRIGAAVPFYGVGGYDQVDLSGITAPVLGHFGTEDGFAPPAQVDALEAELQAKAKGSVEIVRYPGAGHAFFNDEDHMGTYDADLAAQAWARTLEFLRTNVA
jgi:carboxymethylenebutenolidase